MSPHPRAVSIPAPSGRSPGESLWTWFGDIRGVRSGAEDPEGIPERSLVQKVILLKDGGQDLGAGRAALQL